MTALPASGSFAMVDPSHVAAVGPAAAILFARITWRAQETGEWRATRRVLMQETGLTEPMLRTAMAVLREREWVEAKRTSMEDATLIWKPVHAGQGQVTESVTPPSGIRDTPLTESAISSFETGKDNPSIPTDGGGLFDQPVLRSVPKPAELDAEFVRFWGLYPRKTGKIAARKAYGKARRSVSVQQIATGLRRQLPGLIEREARFIPHPSTWLNEGRWDDEDKPSGPVPEQDRVAWEASLPAPRTDPFAAGNR